MVITGINLTTRKFAVFIFPYSIAMGDTLVLEEIMLQLMGIDVLQKDIRGHSAVILEVAEDLAENPNSEYHVTPYAIYYPTAAVI